MSKQPYIRCHIHKTQVNTVIIPNKCDLYFGLTLFSPACLSLKPVWVLSGDIHHLTSLLHQPSLCLRARLVCDSVDKGWQRSVLGRQGVKGYGRISQTGVLTIFMSAIGLCKLCCNFHCSVQFCRFLTIFSEVVSSWGFSVCSWRN